MKVNVEIDGYISTFLLYYEWDSHAELVEFSRFYSFQIVVFDLFRSGLSITRTSTA